MMMAGRRRKRVVVISDLHCGHQIGLTPTGFDPDERPARGARLWDQRREIWNWFTNKISRVGKIDVLIVNGDAVDGKGPASGGTEQLYIDRNDQVEMAASVINYIGARKVLMSYGTSYHTGKQEDWEDAVAREVGAEKIGGEDNVEINGKIINYRHHISRSSVPHGRFTAIAKEQLWNGLWAERGEYPKADIIIRSHVHYHVYCGSSGWLAMTTPGLQGYGSKYGGRRMSGTVDIGFVTITIEKSGEFAWRPVLLRLGLQSPISL